MADPAVNTAGNVANSQPVFQAMTPKQPKAVPLVIDFSIQANWAIDLSYLQQNNTLDYVQSVYVDNSANASSLTLSCPVTQHNILIPPKTQGWFPFLTTVPVKFNAASTGGIQVTIIVCNFPVPPAAWGNQLAFNGAGALQVSDTALEALISGGGLRIGTTVGANYVSPEGLQATYFSAFAAANVSAAGTFLQIQGSATTFIKVRRIGIYGFSAVAADNALLTVAKRSTANAAAGTALTKTPADSNNAAALATVKQITAPGAQGTLVGNIRAGHIALPLSTAPNGDNEVTYDFGSVGDQPLWLRSSTEFVTVDLVTSSAAYANNQLGGWIEWEEGAF